MPKRPTNTKSNFERLYSHYQKKGYTILRKEFRKILKNIKFDNLTYDTAEAIIRLNVNEDSLEDAVRELYKEVGLKYGKQVLKDLNKEKNRLPNMETKASPKGYALFSEEFNKWVSDYFKEKGGDKIRTLNKTMTKKVMRVISEARDEGLSNEEMRQKVQQEVTKSNFYRANTMRIVRTESLTALNTSKQINFDNSSFKMKKKWQLGGSANHREDHVLMDGVEVDYDEDFKLPSGVELKYPGDPNGRGSDEEIASEIINCSCSFSYVPVRDSNGDLVRKD